MWLYTLNRQCLLEKVYQYAKKRVYRIACLNLVYMNSVMTYQPMLPTSLINPCCLHTPMQTFRNSEVCSENYRWASTNSGKLSCTWTGLVVKVLYSIIFLVSLIQWLASHDPNGMWEKGKLRSASASSQSVEGLPWSGDSDQTGQMCMLITGLSLCMFSLWI